MDSHLFIALLEGSHVPKLVVEKLCKPTAAVQSHHANLVLTCLKMLRLPRMRGEMIFFSNSACYSPLVSLEIN